MDLYRAARFYLSLEVRFERAVEGTDEQKATFRTSASDLLDSTPVEEEVSRHIDILTNDMDKFTRNGNFFINLFFKNLF